MLWRQNGPPDACRVLRQSGRNALEGGLDQRRFVTQTGTARGRRADDRFDHRLRP
jgi:hypothetical protein